MASDFTVRITPVPDKKKVIEGLLLVYRTAIENKLARGEIVDPSLVEGLFQGKAQGNGLTGTGKGRRHRHPAQAGS